ncbi:pRiA4b ORF-3-like protein [Candidatus Methanophagaceae archaeon]|nr:pRiA4b ORF-3-like protein [Methanophagales archaeon]
MKKRNIEEGKSIYLLKVTVSDWYGSIRGRPYRTLAIPGEFTLYALAESILDAFEFDFDHGFGFYNNIEDWAASDVRYESSTSVLTELQDSRDAAKTNVDEAFGKPKKKLLFLYDYGEEWHFVVQNTETKVSDGDTEYPEIVKSYAKAPSQYDEDDEADDEEVKGKKEVKRITNSNGRYLQTTLKF